MPTPKKIFLLEDDEVAFTSLKKLLIEFGFEVEGLKDPKNVMSKVKIFKPDLILLDLLMPNLGGLDVCEMLNKDKETQDIPVIIVSALGKLADKKRAFQAGAVGYVTKPYEFLHLLKEIQTVLSHKEIS